MEKGEIFNFAKKFGIGIFEISIFFLLTILSFLLIKFGVTVSIKILPFLIKLSKILSAVLFFILFPLFIFKRIRPFSLATMIISSYIFGITLWVVSAVLAYSIWGIWALVIGFMILGIGVFPVALLATIFTANWAGFLVLVYLFFLMLISKCFPLYVVYRISKKEEEVK